MITKQLLKEYRKYSGDLDSWSRMNRGANGNYNDWILIDSLIQNLRIINGKLASASFTEETNKLLKESCENEDVIKEVFDMAYQ